MFDCIHVLPDSAVNEVINLSVYIRMVGMLI